LITFEGVKIPEVLSSQLRILKSVLDARSIFNKDYWKELLKLPKGLGSFSNYSPIASAKPIDIY
jgi:hypothetical protein